MPSDNVESWKEIATFLGRSVRTVQRWEVTEKLPVRRHVHERGGTIFAYKAELSEWRSSRQFLWNESEEESALQAVVQSQPGGRRKPPATFWKLLGAAVALAAVAAVAVIWFHNPPAEIKPVRVILSESGRISQAVLSPDGTKVIFCWNGERDDGNLDLYLMSTSGGVPKRWTFDPRNDHSATWSADGRSVVFLRDGVGLMVLDAGGAERLLHPQIPGRVYGVGTSWSRDGRSLLYSEKPSEAEATAIFQFTLHSSISRRVTKPPPDSNGDMYPALSPDGGLIAFIRQTRALVSEIYVISPAGGEPHRVTFDEKAIAGADWMPDGRKLVFSSERLGPRRLWTVNIPVREAGPPGIEVLVSAGEGAFQPSVSRHGRLLAYSRRQWTTSIWRLGVPARPGGEMAFTRLITSPRLDTDPAYSPDGKRIAFSSYRSGSTEIWVASSDGRNATQITSLKRQKTYGPSFSPDGKIIAFHSASEKGEAVWVVSASGGPARQITPDAMACAAPAWSKLSGEVYFSCTHVGQVNVWKSRLDSAQPVRVEGADGVRPAISDDGRWLYFIRRGDLIRMGLSRTESAETLIRSTVGSYALTPAGIYFDHGSGDYREGVIEFFDLATRKVHLVRQLSARKASGLSWSIGERALLVPLNEIQSSELVLIDGPF